ncbi:DUF3035 domain-containing protein [Candidatus Pelagibacter sp.]|jgi:hypothetical protein|nr:DUF3035 domain-containing protein [Candidatus Pelagibacter sp.]
MFKKNLLIIFSIFLLHSCSGIKDALSFKKEQGVDEFLIEKKKPLVVPPDYSKLPEPIEEIIASEKKLENDTIKELIDNESIDNKISKTSEGTIELEDSISNILKNK